MSAVEVVALAIQAIGEIVRAANDASSGKVTPEEALARMHAAVIGAKDVDARVDAAVEEKFK